MDHADLLAERFEAHRGHLRAVAFRMLGSLGEADDAVQEAWLRLSRAGDDGVENLGGWLTTVVARVCLDMLRTRASRREEPFERRRHEPAGRHGEAADPEQEAVLADSVGLALLVVLDTLGPAERVAFVLHDVFAVPFAEIAPIVQRSPATTKKLASRARQRVRGGAAVHSSAGVLGGAAVNSDAAIRGGLARQRRVVDAFLAATRSGDLRALLALLDPDVVRRADASALPRGAPVELRGADAVAREVRLSGRRARAARPALVDGAVGAIVAPRGRLRYVLKLTISGGRISAIDVIADEARLRRLTLGVLDE